MNKVICAKDAAALIGDGMTVTISSSSGLACPDNVLAAIGERFEQTGHPRGISTVHPIAAGDMYGIKGIDHLAKPGLLKRIVAGSFPSGPSSSTPPAIWRLIEENQVEAYNVPSGILFDLHREVAARKPGVLTKVGLDTFVDPDREGCAMNDAAADPIVRKIDFEGSKWLFFPAIAPNVAIIRATTADERGNLTFEGEGAYLGVMEQSLAARNAGGIVIAQVKRLAASGTLRPHDVHVPGILVDYIVVDPDQQQTTMTLHDPSISGEVVLPLSAFSTGEWTLQKAIARRVAMELSAGTAVNIGFGISAHVPRVLLEEGLHGQVTWVIEQGAVGGLPLLDFQFGCASNAEAIVPSPYQFLYFQGGGFDASLLSFLEIDRNGSVNVSKLSARSHVTAGIGGFADITSHARKIVFSGLFAAGAPVSLENGMVRIGGRAKVRKLVEAVEHVSFSGHRGLQQGQEVLYVTERCVMELRPEGVTVTEIAPGIELQRDILDEAGFPLLVANRLVPMAPGIFQPSPVGLQLKTLRRQRPL